MILIRKFQAELYCQQQQKCLEIAKMFVRVELS